MPNENNFSDIPSLSDTEGLQNFMSAQAVADAGVNPIQESQPATQTDAPAPAPLPAPAPAAQPAPQQYTAEQVQQIVQRTIALQQQQAAQQQRAAQVRTGGYTPQQQQAIINALNRGMTLDQIQAALNQAQQQRQADYATQQRLAAIEQQMANQEYQRAESEFINKCVAFGDKWGLSEQDLVTFGNVALQKGINIAQVPDLEVAFRAVYPEQYAIRAQRMRQNPTSQIYGGTSSSDGASAAAQKAADMYVESFLKGAMPNLYKPK